jgi:hypothetical protein
VGVLRFGADGRGLAVSQKGDEAYERWWRRERREAARARA